MKQKQTTGGWNAGGASLCRGAALGCIALSLVAVATRAELSEDIVIGAYPTYARSLLLDLFGLDNSRRVFVVAPQPGGEVTGGGIALDKAGNVYLSDYGATTNAGSIIMIPADGRPPLRIMQDLDRPSDIEISPDGHTLVIAEPDGRVDVRDFGVSVRVLFASVVPLEPVARLQTDAGNFTATRAADGYFHFAGAGGPQQETGIALLIVDNGPFTQAFVLNFQTVDGAVHGHTVADLVF